MYVYCTPTTQMTEMSLLAHLHTSCMTPKGGTDIASSLFPASLLPISEASAACSQGQAKEGKRALQLRDCCQPTGVSASLSIQERECRAPMHCLHLLFILWWTLPRSWSPPKMSPVGEMELLSSTVFQETTFLTLPWSRVCPGFLSCQIQRWTREKWEGSCHWVWDNWGSGRAVGFGHS